MVLSKTHRLISWISVFINVYQVLMLAGICCSNELKDEVHNIVKRDIYMTFQDRAQAICIGFCMYQERKSYYRCQRKCKIGSESDKRKKVILKEENQILKNEEYIQESYISKAPNM